MHLSFALSSSNFLQRKFAEKKYVLSQKVEERIERNEVGDRDPRQIFLLLLLLFSLLLK